MILDEILMHADEPADLVVERCFGALFPDHPLGRDALGTAESVGAITDDRRPAILRDATTGRGTWWSRWPGDCRHDDVARAIEERFAGTPGGAAPAATARPGDPAEPLVVLRRPTEQAHLTLGIRCVSRFDDDRWAFSVLNHVLGGGMSCRLFQKVREQRGLAYSIGSERLAYQDAGSLCVVVGTAPDHVDEVLHIVADELELLGLEGMTERELAVAKGYLRAEALLAGEDSLGADEPDRGRAPAPRRGEDDRADPGAHRPRRPGRRPPGGGPAPRRAADARGRRALRQRPFDGAALGLAGHVA